MFTLGCETSFLQKTLGKAFDALFVLIGFQLIGILECNLGWTFLRFIWPTPTSWLTITKQFGSRILYQSKKEFSGYVQKQSQEHEQIRRSLRCRYGWGQSAPRRTIELKQTEFLQKVIPMTQNYVCSL